MVWGPLCVAKFNSSSVQSLSLQLNTLSGENTNGEGDKRAGAGAKEKSSLTHRSPHGWI